MILMLRMCGGITVVVGGSGSRGAGGANSGGDVGTGGVGVSGGEAGSVTYEIW